MSDAPRASTLVLPGIQFLRALAALAVVAHHTIEESNAAAGRFSPDWLTTSGAAGVDIFFVISGFIMLYISFPEDRAPLRPARFLYNRLTRIYPLYWVACAIIVGLSLIGFYKGQHWTFSDAMRSLVLYPSPHRLIGIAWTLIYEMYFYAIFALTLLARSRAFSVVASTIVISGLFIAAPAVASTPERLFIANPIAIEFLLGLYLAWSYRNAGEKWDVHWRWAVPGFLLLALAPVFVAHQSTAGLPGLARVFVWGLPATLIVASFLRIGRSAGRVAHLGLLLGNASYAIYLFHEFVMIGYARALKIPMISAVPQQLLVPFIIVAAAAAGLLVHLYVEKPMLGFIRRLRPMSRSTGRP